MMFVSADRLRFAAAGAFAAAIVAASTEPARAQPATRGQPVLRTPPTRTPPAGAPHTGALGAPAGKPGDDPISALHQGDAGIDFKPKPGGFAVNFNLDDADLPDLVKAIAQVTGKRFIFAGKLRQIKATVVSPEKITADEAYRAFLSILETNGMTVIPHGRFLKIVETPGVVTFTTPVYGPAQPVPAEDRYVTRLVRLQHIDATDASTVLNKFKSRDGDITAYPPGNLLIVTETGSNIARMMRILEEVDVGGAGEQLWVEKINYTSASELANKIDEILDLKKPGAGGPGARAEGRGAGRGRRSDGAAHRRGRPRQRAHHHRDGARLPEAARAHQAPRPEALGRGRDPCATPPARGVQGPRADAEPAPRHVGVGHGRRRPPQDDAGHVRRARDPRRGGLGDRPGVRGPRPHHL